MNNFRLSIKLLFVLLLPVCVGTAFVRPSDELLTRMLRQLSTYTETYAPEKVYLHLDKPYYFAGDDLWFKAYVVNAATHVSDTASGVLYVELWNEKGTLVASEKVKLTGGTGHGDFALNEGLPTATYQIRAYTRWMQNGSSDFYFTRQFSILNPTDKPVASPVSDAGLDLQFFPEGGDLVEGLSSTVAFKAVTRQGKGVATQVIVLSDNDTIGRFASKYMGMGSFSFTPAPGKTYQALVRNTSGKIVSFALPKPRPQGWVMHAENISGSLQLTVRSNKNVEEKLYVIAQTRGKATFQSEGRLVNNTFGVQIPTAQLPSGITQLTVFDANGMPQCERLVFVSHPDQIRLELTADKKSYQPREKVTLTLAARDAQGNPVAGNFSLSVHDARTFASPEHTILTNLLLTSDLKGTIENPAFYFQPDNAGAPQALDHLMLTQGWRRFTWKDVMQPNLPEPLYEHEPDIALTVNLVDKTTGKSMPSQILLISAPGTSSVFRYGYTNPQGKIYLNSLDFYDYRNVIVSIYNKDIQASARVVADSVRQTTAGAGELPPFSASAAMQQAFHQKKVWSVIQRNYTSSESNPTEVVTQDTLRPVQPVYQQADDKIKLDEYTLFPTMEEVIRDIVPWGILTHKKGKTGFRLLDPQTKLYFKHNPIYLIDNVPVHSIDPVLALDPSTVYSIESVRSAVGRAQFGEIGYHGIFSVFTKAGDFYPSNEPGLFNFSVRGFQSPREYYAPKYENPAPPSRQPDFRNLLYWNPSIVTDANGKATVTFYNSDDITSWRAVLEGISAQGRPIAGMLEYQVKMEMPR